MLAHVRLGLAPLEIDFSISTISVSMAPVSTGGRYLSCSADSKSGTRRPTGFAVQSGKGSQSPFMVQD
jgi:hypothetical protein